MEITTTVDDNKATIEVKGKLTVQTAPELEDAVSKIDAGIGAIDIDFTKLEYISSAGLRVLVATQKTMMGRGGSLTIKHPNDEVFEVFEMTGLSEVLDIER